MGRTRRSPAARAVAGALLVAVGWAAASAMRCAAAADVADGPCARSARHAFRSCTLEAQAAFWRAIAECDHLPPDERRAGRDAARAAYEAAIAACEETQRVRLEVCGALPDAYDPRIDPERFVPEVTHPLFPLLPGTVWLYRETDEEGVADLTMEVLPGRRRFEGVRCTTVRTTKTQDGVPIEQTLEWFAQDAEGNVWLFGEFSREYKSGEIVAIETWTAGREGARPGIVMPAVPAVGDTFRQGLAVDRFEDVTTIVQSGQSVEVPAGKYRDIWVTIDDSPLEPDDVEEKYYAPGVGLVLEIGRVTGSRTELIEVRRP